MKAMEAYAIKCDETLALRAFSSKRAAARAGNGQHIFSTVDELANSRLTNDEARVVYNALTGVWTNVSERQQLAELLFVAIRHEKLPQSDKGPEVYITCTPGAKAPEQKSNAKKEKPMTEEVEVVVKEKTDRKFARAPRSDTHDAIEAYGVHPESNRAALLNKLVKKIGQQVKVEELAIAVYGTNERRNLSSLSMVLKGLFAIQSANNIDVEIRKQKSKEEGITYGLYLK